ncbi:MAG TPA: hypothetical protein VK104_06355 [Burkholderiaceae bacterium]|nr:hypothetical protein [Burkholderiaceae bacterium]
MLLALLAVAAVMFGLYNVFIKLSADHIQAVLGAVILQFVAAFLGLALLLVLKVQQGLSLHANSRGIWMAIAAGVAIGLVEILTFVIYGRGVPVAVGNPLIIGGSVVVTTGLGVWLLRETITLVPMLAILMIAGGILLLAWNAARL